jgi:hypothetical protein
VSDRFLFHCDAANVADPGPEIDIQVRLQVRIKKIAPSIRLVAVPNGMKTSAWGAMQARREGMSGGFPDLIAIAPSNALIAFLEIKAKTGVLSNTQIAWLTHLQNAGFNVGCFRSVDTAITALRLWGFPFADDAIARAVA